MNRDALVVGINRYPFLSHLSTPAFDAEAISPDGKIIASGGLEHLGPVQSIGFSPDGQTLVSGSADATVKIWQRS
jgi:WD40 repeat protein